MNVIKQQKCLFTVFALPFWTEQYVFTVLYVLAELAGATKGCRI
jgi:hypothetical protein